MTLIRIPDHKEPLSTTEMKRVFNIWEKRDHIFSLDL